MIAAYRQYANLVPPDTFRRYLADLLDLETHARNGRLLVAELDRWVCGFAAFYPDATLQEVGFPRGWASGRALAVHPAARGHGVARIMSDTCERLARDSGAPVFAFHTVSFMTGAIATYERLGYHRAPEFDVHWAHNDAGSDSAPIISFAFLRHLARNHSPADGVRPARCTATPDRPKQRNHNTASLEESMTTQIRTRRVSGPAYYLGRPAAFWLAAQTRRSAARRSSRVSRAA